MSEPSHQPSQEHPHAFAIGIHDVLTGPPHEGELGEGVLLRTDRGDIQAILHPAPERQHGVIWVGGARGGFGRPGHGAYARLADGLRRDGILLLRLCYRTPTCCPNVRWMSWPGSPICYRAVCSPSCSSGTHWPTPSSLLQAIARSRGGRRRLSAEAYGSRLARKLAPRPLLVVHGKADTRLPYSCGVQIYEWAPEPKRLALYEGAEHHLNECADALDERLTQSIATLRPAG